MAKLSEHTTESVIKSTSNNGSEIVYHFHSENEIIKLLNQTSLLSVDEIYALINEKLKEYFSFDHFSLMELLTDKSAKACALMSRSFQEGEEMEHWSGKQSNFELSRAILNVCEILDNKSDDLEIREIPDLKEFVVCTHNIDRERLDSILTGAADGAEYLIRSPGIALLKAGYRSCLRIFFKTYKKIYMLQLSNRESGSFFNLDSLKYNKLQILISVLKTAFVKQDAIEALKQKLGREFEIGFSNWMRFTTSLTQIKHQVTGDHCWRSYIKAKPILDYVISTDFKGLAVSEKEKEGIRLLGSDIVSALIMLHDIGKIGLPDKILNNTDSLSKGEYEIIKQHPLLGKAVAVTAREDLTEFLSQFDDTEKIEKRLSFIYNFLEDITGGHHEDFDGKGYPRGSKGEEIPFLARITRVIDTHDGALHNRSYQKAMPKDKLLKYLEDNKNTRFDGAIVNIFLKFTDEFDRIDQEYPDTASS